MTGNKLFIIISILVSLALVGWAASSKNAKKDENIPANNVSIIDGKQIIELRAKGGFTPKISQAKAGTPTVLRFNTSGTFDCSSSVRIPSLDVSQILPPSGITDIDLGSQKAGTLQGMCGMGMYPFEIIFE